jgi:P27 family predicted phage terminase small subunit
MLAEPRPALKAPKPPADLSPGERVAWDRFCAAALKLRVISEDDWAAMEQLAFYYSEAQTLREFIRKKGRTYNTTTYQGDTMVRPRPEVTMLREADRNMLNLLGRFGLTPADRAKVRATPGAQHKNNTDPDNEFT